ncbi:hypothetical protein BM221_005118 [Beauveria bassiana]|uniref:Uncharacterized protein n=1 Tax=Beauveria bassiana TaxID=176275 RepID=A0A2N6NMP0_BEABA|nr:hypothetical protein BM221_005118 [Beauveria bassiana]
MTAAWTVRVLALCIHNTDMPNELKRTNSFASQRSSGTVRSHSARIYEDDWYGLGADGRAAAENIS